MDSSSCSQLYRCLFKVDRWVLYFIYPKYSDIEACAINPFIPSGLLSLFLDSFVSNFRSPVYILVLSLNTEIHVFNTKSVNPDQTSRCAASLLVYTVCQCSFNGLQVSVAADPTNVTTQNVELEKCSTFCFDKVRVDANYI